MRRIALLDPKRIVEEGYNRIAPEYERWSVASTDHARECYAGVLLNGLPAGATVLDLGCGSGALLTYRLAQHFRVTGVELSSCMVELARRNVPNATFLHADMASIKFPPESFNGVCAFYSMTHLPPQDLPGTLMSVSSWLKPGGLFVASMGTSDDPGSVESDWIGVPMFFAGHTPQRNQQLVEGAGLHLVDARLETIQEKSGEVTFLWIVARKPERMLMQSERASENGSSRQLENRGKVDRLSLPNPTLSLTG